MIFVLKTRLNAFQNEMLRKFLNVAYKHPDRDVTDDKFDWNQLTVKELYEHFWAEVRELEESGDYSEMIDIASMAFLLHWKSTQGLNQKVSK